MLRILLIAVLLIAGCGQADDSSGPSPDPVIPALADDGIQVIGKEAYDQVCARCHEEGLDGAPKTGDRDAWAGRSWLWEAVLFEHAKQGYMEMPAKGGEGALDDAAVEMAAEYMLTRAFPEAVPAD